MTLIRPLVLALAGAALFFAGAATQSPSEAREPAYPKVALELRSSSGKIISAEGSDRGSYRYRLAARIHRPVGSGRYRLRLTFRDAKGRRTGALAFDTELTAIAP